MHAARPPVSRSDLFIPCYASRHRRGITVITHPPPDFPMLQPIMDIPYYSHFMSGIQHVASQRTMPPPLAPASSLHRALDANQNHTADYESSRINLEPANSLLTSTGQILPLNSSTLWLDFGNPRGGSNLPSRSSLQSQKASGRTKTITQETWTRHKSTLHRIWIEKNKSLQETMAIMSSDHHFNAS